ncbi:MAG: hypothetical protein H0X60_04235, partial [Chloroflexi bacterium]|nr:hypothetical protein [Chloroflexota bacterium]
MERPGRPELTPAVVERGLLRLEVAVDAAGVPGGRSYTYHVPAGPELANLGPGDAVLVPYGRRQVVGVVLGEGKAAAELATKPVLARIHADRSLLPPLQARLAAWMAQHYLAPPGMVVRAMLPPGLLERVELVARALDGLPTEKAGGTEPWGALLVVVQGTGAAGMAVDDLPASPDRATVRRLLRDAEAAGRLSLEWRLRPPGARPRLERVARLTAAGSVIGHDLAAGRAPSGRQLGPRQQALLREMVAADAPGSVSAAHLAASHGPSTVTGLARRG